MATDKILHECNKLIYLISPTYLSFWRDALYIQSSVQALMTLKIDKHLWDDFAGMGFSGMMLQYLNVPRPGLGEYWLFISKFVLSLSGAKEWDISPFLL